MVSIAIMGHGVVGSGVAEILLTHKQKLFASIGEEIYIKKRSEERRVGKECRL